MLTTEWVPPVRNFRSSSCFFLCLRQRLVQALLDEYLYYLRAQSGSDPDILANYRPISVLLFYPKSLRRVCKAASGSFRQAGLISRFHSHFRRCHSTKTAIVKTVNDVLSSNDGRKVTTLVLFDL